MTKLCLLLMIALQLQVQAQKRGQEYLDSMVADIPTAKEDTNKVKLLYRIGNGYSGTDAAKSEYYILQCIALSKKLGWQKGVASGYNTLGDLQLNTGVSDSAFYYYNLCYQINKEIGNQEGVVWALSDLGDYEDRRSNAVGAIKYYMDALPAAEKTGKPKMVSMLYSHISTVYYHQDNFDKAASFISKAMAIDKTAGDDSKMAEYAEMLGNISNSKHDSASALKYYFQALELHTAADHKLGIATLYQQLGTVLPTVNERIAYKIKARNLWDSISPGHLLAVVNIGNLGYDYFLMEKNKLLVKPDVNIPPGKNERLALAEKYLTEAVSLAKAGDDPDDQQYFSLILSELYQEKG
ncbi:MAG: tetratricopeptide repeat protein, partial [Sphingobacteriales bacterium]